MGIAFLHKDKYSIKKGKTTPPDFYIDPKQGIQNKSSILIYGINVTVNRTTIMIITENEQKGAFIQEVGKIILRILRKLE